jgi:shikimate kinase / 3-dehydroquinate synthase
MTGFMATGKTTNGRRLAEHLGLAFADTDAMVEARAGKAISRIFAEDGEAVFRDLEHGALCEALRGPRAVVSTGGGAMTQERNLALMQAAGPIICLEARPETVLKRTAARDDRPLLEGDDRLGTIRALMAERAPAYARADYALPTDRMDKQGGVAELVKVLAADPRGAVLARPSVRVGVRAGEAQYQIHIEAGALAALGKLCPAPTTGTRCAVVTTDVVGPLYGPEVLAALAAGGWQASLLPVPDGERSKSLATAGELYGRLVEAGVDAGGAVFALGGGVVGDLAGFVAATYRRGVRFVQLPTSLLAQVDASVGGKVAVDHPRAKNLIGAFHQPAAVVMDTRVLLTLSQRELRGGLCEVIKHAAIADEELFRYLEAELDAFLALQDAAVRYVLARSCQIKASVVEDDPLDRGGRAVLNYGHTVGHAVEVAAGEWELRHGEAVAIGMAAEARLGEQLGLTEPGTAERLACLLGRVGLPTAAPGLDCALAEAALLQDKKIAAGSLRLPYVPRVGEVGLTQEVPVSALREALRRATSADGASGRDSQR